jgi:hypothetical protein
MSATPGLTRDQSSIKSVVKRTFWLDADTYQKLVEIRSKRLSQTANVFMRRGTFTTILTDALHQFVEKHGSRFPRKRRISVSFPRQFALTFRYTSRKVRVTETDILNMAIREFDEAAAEQQRSNGILPETDEVSPGYSYPPEKGE